MIRTKTLIQIGNEKCGLIKEKAREMHFFSLTMLMERATEVKTELYVCFVDYEKPFDRVKHVDLLRMLERLDTDGKDLRLTKNLLIYWRQEAAVRV